MVYLLGKMNNLNNFFAPQRIAFIGASEDGLYPAGIMQNLIENQFPGKIYPVNPKRSSVFGLPCYSSIKDLPESPDLALLTIPRKAVLPVIIDCIEARIPAALIISAGFGESDKTGITLQADLKQIISEHSIRVIGPNCAGLASIPDSFIATRLSGEIVVGSVAFASQSGALMMSLQGVFSDRNIGISRLVSLGNQVDVCLAEILETLVDDPKTKVITTFMEGLSHGPQLIHAFRKALIFGKPVIMLKTGRTERGIAAAATHTAAMAGEDRIFKAICDQFGVILVADVEPLMDTAQLADKFKSIPGNIGFISQSGGMGSLTADMIETHNVFASPIPNDLEKALRQLGTIPDYARLLNPADVRGASVSAEAAGSTLQAFLDSHEYDAVVMLFARSLINDKARKTAQSIASISRKTDKPVIVIWSGQRKPNQTQVDAGAQHIFNDASIPVFTQPSSMIRALQRLKKYHDYRKLFLQGFQTGSTNE